MCLEDQVTCLPRTYTHPEPRPPWTYPHGSLHCCLSFPTSIPFSSGLASSLFPGFSSLPLIWVLGLLTWGLSTSSPSRAGRSGGRATAESSAPGEVPGPGRWKETPAGICEAVSTHRFFLALCSQTWEPHRGKGEGGLKTDSLHVVSHATG